MQTQGARSGRIQTHKPYKPCTPSILWLLVISAEHGGRVEAAGQRAISGSVKPIRVSKSTKAKGLGLYNPTIIEKVSLFWARVLIP